MPIEAVVFVVLGAVLMLFMVRALVRFIVGR